MNITLVVDTFGRANGGTIATLRLVEGLRRRGYKITIVAAKADAGEEFYQVKGGYLPGTRESQEKMGFLFGVPDKKVLKKAYENADLVQIQFPFYLGYGAAKVARKLKKNVIGAFHVQPQNIIAAMGKESNFMEWLISKVFNFFLFNRVPLIQCPSQFAADLLVKKKVKSRLRVISNGIPTEYRAENYERPAFFGDKLVLLNFGRHALEKRQSLIIEAVKRCKYADKIQLMLCGKGELSTALIEQSAELPIKPLIEYVSHEDKLLYLNTADLYVHGSIVELESLSCLEAIGCGLPCLISDSRYSASQQFALDNRFIFESDNVENLAEKLNYWYEHKNELRGIRTQVLKMAEHYRFERCLDLMEELYAEATGVIIDKEKVLEPNLL